MIERYDVVAVARDKETRRSRRVSHVMKLMGKKKKVASDAFDRMQRAYPQDDISNVEIKNLATSKRIKV